MGKFTLSITTGNEAMQYDDDVAGALDQVAENIRSGGLAETAVIRDANGNTVGQWGYEPDGD